MSIRSALGTLSLAALLQGQKAADVDPRALDQLFFAGLVAGLTQMPGSRIEGRAPQEIVAQTLLQMIGHGKRSAARTQLERDLPVLKQDQGGEGEGLDVEAIIELARETETVPDVFAVPMAQLLKGTYAPEARMDLARAVQAHHAKAKAMRDALPQAAPALARMFGDLLDHAVVQGADHADRVARGIGHVQACSALRERDGVDLRAREQGLARKCRQRAARSHRKRQQGHESEESVGKALDDAAEYAHSYKILGSFPRATKAVKKQLGRRNRS